MKKDRVGIITIVGYENYGNQLQNYAVQKTIEDLGYEAITLKNHHIINTKDKFIIRIPKFFIYKYKEIRKYNKNRYKKFKEFSRNIKKSKIYVTPYSKISNKYKCFIVGSDQVWKSTYGRLRDVDLLCFAKDNQKIAFSASFGINELPDNKKEYTQKNLKSFKAISVREDAGKKIVEDLTGRKDVEVLIDPTMMLDSKEWDAVAKKPSNLKDRRYILNYFLGEIPNEYKTEIERIAEEYDCEIINLLNPNDSMYETGPAEFLYLEKNAFLVCTDSFHSCVFSIIYDTPFINFNRTDNRINMNSRLETLLNKFDLNNRRFNGVITENMLECDYSEAKKILQKEKMRVVKYLKNALTD